MLSKSKALSLMASFLFTHPSHVAANVSEVPIKHNVQTFNFNQSFATPPTQGMNEPVWDALIPSTCSTCVVIQFTKQLADGLGYVKDNPISGADLAVISSFHQLHCLVCNSSTMLKAALKSYVPVYPATRILLEPNRWRRFRFRTGSQQSYHPLLRIPTAEYHVLC